ncbi:hypothetical protein AWV80_05945 [Cupriavidus sp. UYMU48A]|nr:hypothetical protein AWV80_05945 [Cupriavidus sp. UYMU48A]
MMALRAGALVAIAAWHVFEQRTVRHLPRRMLRIRQRVQVDDGRAERGRDMHGAAVVRHEQVSRFEQRPELSQRQHAGQRHDMGMRGIAAHAVASSRQPPSLSRIPAPPAVRIGTGVGGGRRFLLLSRLPGSRL